MIDVSVCLLSERKRTKHEIYIIPLKAKVGTSWGVKKHMFVATLIVERRLEMTRKNVPGKVLKMVQLKGKIAYLSS